MMEIKVCEMEDRMETRQKQLENADVKSMQDAIKQEKEKRWMGARQMATLLETVG